MSLTTTQRFITGLSVYDTYNGLDGTISEMNLNNNAVHSLSLLYVGPYFVVMFTDMSLQLFNIQGKRVNATTGVVLKGVTLLNTAEKNALLGAGYPG